MGGFVVKVRQSQINSLNLSNSGIPRHPPLSDPVHNPKYEKMSIDEILQMSKPIVTVNTINYPVAELFLSHCLRLFPG
jgi:hypothetical protein